MKVIFLNVHTISFFGHRELADSLLVEQQLVLLQINGGNSFQIRPIFLQGKIICVTREQKKHPIIKQNNRTAVPAAVLL